MFPGKSGRRGVGWNEVYFQAKFQEVKPQEKSVGERLVPLPASLLETWKERLSIGV